jgi:MFS family permease
VFKEIADLRHFKGFGKVILPISVAFFIYTFGWGVLSPVFSIYVNGITKSAELTGIILSVTTFFGIILNIPFMVIIDRINMKRVLQIVLLAYAAFALLYPMADNFTYLMLISIGRGIASSFLWLTSWAYVFGFVNQRVRGKETGFFSSMNDFASGIAPLVGGFATLISFVFPFYVLAFTSLLSFAVITMFVHSSPKINRTPAREQFGALVRNMKKSNFLKTVLLIVVFYALMNAFYSFISIFLHAEGVSILDIGVVLTVALLPAVVLEVPIGNLIDRHGVKKVIAIASVAAAATGFLFAMSTNIVYLGGLILAFTISYTAIFIALYSRMSNLIKKEGLSLLGPMAAIKDMGYTIGPLAGGFVIGIAGIAPAFAIFGAGYLLLLPIALTLKS